MNTEQTQSSRNSLSENLALTFALPCGLIVSIGWLIAFYFLHRPIALTGWPSIGAAVLINAAALTFVGFILGYLRGQKALAPGERLHLSKPKFIFDCLTLATAYTIIAVVLTAVSIYIFSLAFKDLTMPALSAAMVVAVYAIVTVYGIISTSVHLQSRDIVNALTVFIAGGVIASMITSTNPLWWEINFSSLGTSSSVSSYAFNFTLVLSGLLLLSLTDHLLSDLGLIIRGKQKTTRRKTEIIKILFVAISLCLAGVGLFPWNIHPGLHDGSAYGLVLCFSIMIVALRWLLPAMSKSFLANSYMILVALISGFVLWRPLHYFSQTAFELIAFSLTFIWLVLFLRSVSLMRELKLSKS